MPQPRARRSRTLLVGLPVFAVFAAFSAIVWLAYEHGAQGPPIGEPPLIKAPTLAIKLPPDQAGAPAVADQGEVRDLLTDAQPGNQPERLLPQPEQPQAPLTAAPEPDDGSGDVAAVAPPPPDATAPDSKRPGHRRARPRMARPRRVRTPEPPRPTAQPARRWRRPDRTPAARPPMAPQRTARRHRLQVAAAPPQAAPAPAQSPPAPAQAAPAPAVSAPAPAQAAAPPAQVATAPTEPPRETPLAVERQSTAPSGAQPPSGAPQPTPKEAEAALDALLAEVTTGARPTPAAPDGVQAGGLSQTRAPAPSTVSELPPVTSPARQPPAPPAAQLTPPSSVSPPAGHETGVAAVTPDTRAPTGGAAATAATTPRPSSTPTLEPAPNGGVAALEGGYRIQLAAVRDEADARRAWDLYLVDLGPVLRGVQPFIERAETGNGTFYRVQIGPFANQQEAELLCDELKRRNASCFVIRR